jgi:hypothetical protein
MIKQKRKNSGWFQLWKRDSISMSESLAINGGGPVRKKLLPYGQQWIDEDDIKSVSDVLRTDWITQGSKISEF